MCECVLELLNLCIFIKIVFFDLSIFIIYIKSVTGTFGSLDKRLTYSTRHILLEAVACQGPINRLLTYWEEACFCPARNCCFEEPSEMPEEYYGSCPLAGCYSHPVGIHTAHPTDPAAPLPGRPDRKPDNLSHLFVVYSAD